MRNTTEQKNSETVCCENSSLNIPLRTLGGMKVDTMSATQVVDLIDGSVRAESDEGEYIGEFEASRIGGLDFTLDGITVPRLPNDCDPFSNEVRDWLTKHGYYDDGYDQVLAEVGGDVFRNNDGSYCYDITRVTVLSCGEDYDIEGLSIICATRPQCRHSIQAGLADYFVDVFAQK